MFGISLVFTFAPISNFGIMKILFSFECKSLGVVILHLKKEQVIPMASRKNSDSDSSEEEEVMPTSDEDLLIETEYDSDEMQEYVPTVSEVENDSSDDSVYQLVPKKARKPSFKWSPRKRLRLTSTSKVAVPTTSSTLDAGPSTSTIAGPTTSSTLDVSLSTPTPAVPSPPSAPDATAAALDSTSLPGEDEEHGLLVKFNRNRLRGKNGHAWTSKPPTRVSTRTPSRNIMPPFRKGPVLRQFVNTSSPESVFNLLFDDDIIKEIITWTNASIVRLSSKFPH